MKKNILVGLLIIALAFLSSCKKPIDAEWFRGSYWKGNYHDATIELFFKTNSNAVLSYNADGDIFSLDCTYIFSAPSTIMLTWEGESSICIFNEDSNSIMVQAGLVIDGTAMLYKQ